MPAFVSSSPSGCVCWGEGNQSVCVFIFNKIPSCLIFLSLRAYPGLSSWAPAHCLVLIKEMNFPTSMHIFSPSGICQAKCTVDSWNQSALTTSRTLCYRATVSSMFSTCDFYTHQHSQDAMQTLGFYRSGALFLSSFPSV